MDAEKNYILSLLSRPDESPDKALERFWRVGLIDLMEVSNAKRRSILSLVQDNASQDRATSIRLAAQYAELDAAGLEKAAMSIDPDGVDVYARLMLEQHRHAKVRQVTESLLSEENDSQELIESMQRELAQIRLSREEVRITQLPQAGRNFIEWLKNQQAQMKAGIPRISMYWASLDDKVPYLFPGNVILLTAKTKVGKSSFSADWFDAQLRRGWVHREKLDGGFRGLYFHFEDPPEVMGLKRTARLVALESEYNIPFRKMLMGLLTDSEMKELERLNEEAGNTWATNGTQIFCADWSMSQVARVWQREHFNRRVDFVVIDYLNKAKLTGNDERNLGVYESRARDAEIVKSTNEGTGGIAMLVQQEGDDGQPFQTRQAAQKSQVHISLQRNRLGEDQGRALSPFGKIAVMNANLGSTGDIDAVFLTEYMMWDEGGNDGTV